MQNVIAEELACTPIFRMNAATPDPFTAVPVMHEITLIPLFSSGRI
jgi:hypothetical protein